VTGSRAGTAGEPPGTWPTGFAAGPRDREALLVLAHLEGMTPREIHALAWERRSAAACVDAVTRGAAGSAADRERVQATNPKAVRRALTDCGAALIAPGEPGYPADLLHLADPPGWLFVRGALSPGEHAVAVVGARNCSPYGREVAEGLGAGLAAAGVTVVSGAARGVDAAAHRGALRVRGRTVAVLGSGIDVPYPRSHRRLLEDIAGTGAVVSEYPPGMFPHPRRFPARNRIVAGLSRAVVVVEGAPGSGSLITAEFVQDLHREVLAVPGPVTSELSAAPHELIRDGAGLVRDAEDVLEAIGLGSGGSADGAPSSAPAGLTEGERRALEALTGSPQLVEQVAAGAGLDPGVALRTLTALELRGLVRVDGGRYRRTIDRALEPAEAGGGLRRSEGEPNS
jgi:DNA processing protein